MKRVVAVEVPRSYVLLVTFDDGVRREIDMEPELWGEAFEPLREPSLFAQAQVDPLLRTVVWPNGADVSPEFLYFGDKNPYALFVDETEADVGAPA